jgi:serine/threonine-protein kinase
MAVTLAMRGVVHIFDADPGHGWIAMEYVQRGALADLLRAGDTTELHPARGWFRDLIEVVACIHERGFVHADLKPANVLIQGPSQVLVSDFGLALPFGSPHLGASAGYVSPERQAGASASAPDDVFSLGCILERVLDAVGERGPFATEPWRALADRLTRGDRPPDAGAALALVPATRAPEP